MKKLIGTKDFYKKVFVILLPIMLQQFVTNFVNVLDNMMVGQLGTLEFSGVSIVNQLVSVYNLVTFGSMAAVGIFAAQYAGNKDYKGIKQCLHLKMIFSILIFTIGCIVFLGFGKPLISLYLSEASNTPEAIATTLNAAQDYLRIILAGLLPFVLVQAFSSTLRETGDTFLPMVSSTTAVIVNAVFNWLLIFGHFGFPCLGIKGAAYATNLSRIVELGVLVYMSLTHREKYPFLNVPIRFLSVPLELVGKVVRRGSPLIFNELIFAVSGAFIAQCYSTRGLDAVAAVNMTTTITHLFTILNYGLGNAVSIMVGQALGAGDHERAKDHDHKLLALSITLCAFMGCVMFMVSPAIPEIYKTSAEVKHLASMLLRVSAVMMPVQAAYIGSYFTLRSGGKTVLTMMFDSGYITLVSFPIAYCLSHFTALPIFTMYLIVVMLDVPKALLGLYLVGKGIWVNTII